MATSDIKENFIMNDMSLKLFISDGFYDFYDESA